MSDTHRLATRHRARWATAGLLVAILGVGGSCGRGEVSSSAGSASPGTAAPGSAPTVSAPVAPPPAPPPEVVARQYLERGGHGQDVRDLVDPRCHDDTNTMTVDAVRMMGAPMTIAELTVTPQPAQGDSASVQYAVRGSVHAQEGQTTLFGAKVTVHGVNIDNASQSGTLGLARIGGQWRVTCPAAASAPTP